MAGQILKELKSHAPFTIFGTITGIVIMAFTLRLPYETSYNIFYVLHPLHVFLSALVTAAMYKLHTCPNVGVDCIKGKCNFWILIIIGYVGSVGIATISDSLIPYAAEYLLGMPNRGIHLGFIEKWWLVNPLAILGIVIAYVKPRTKFSHAGHVLLSTWASLFHMIMAKVEISGWFTYAAIFIFLFLAVWIPCCVSDIVFPLLFIKKENTAGENKKLVHKAVIAWNGENNTFLCSLGKQTIKIAAALGVKKHDDMRTPEELFVSSIEGFIKDAFVDYAKRNNLDFLSYSSEAKGVLKKIEDKLMFTEIKIRISIEVALSSQIEKADKAIRFAKDNCFISDCVGSIITLCPEIKAKC